MVNSFNNALIGQRINQGIPPVKDDIFGQFIGKWNFDLTIYDSKEEVTELKGSWIFERILNGHVIQDIWIVPLQNSKENENNFFEYGTSVRTYDLKAKKWKVTWIGPILTQHFVFDVEQIGFEIHLKLINHAKFKMRWISYSIEEKTFQWRSEIFLMDKCKWFTNCHMMLIKNES